MFFDTTYILVLIGIGLTMLASLKLKSTFSKFSRIRSVSGYTGQEVARMILNANGIYDVNVNPVSGSLTDHYDPASKTVNLSGDIYGSNSIAAISVAAHECGHAIQHNVGFIPLSFRSLLVPVANFGATLSWPLVLIGLMLGNAGSFLIQIGIILFMCAVLFQVVTLPVEFDASRRAIIELEKNSILPEQERKGAKDVLFAAALTYVAATAASMLQLLRLIILRDRNR
jgi:neutral zinc metallopeptidase family protein